MEQRSNVVKSKSSNSAIATKSELRASTRSHLHFHRNITKKRGVYVEHKDTMTRIGGSEANTRQEKPVKAPPRPRPGQKKFLTSVLTILSKTTESTQCPDDGSNSAIRQTNNPRQITRGRPEKKKNEVVNDTQKKKKYRSKILSNSVGKDEKDQQIIVLQEQKDIKHTSSIFYENNSANFTNLTAFIKNTRHADKEQKKPENITDTAPVITNTALRKNLEEKQMKRDKRVRIEDPTTLVSVINAGTQDTTTKDNGKGMYNFFVDLLETIDVYNATDIDKEVTLSSSTSSSKVPLEINESVANKLVVKCDSSNCEGKTRSSSRGSQFYCFKDDGELRRTKQLISETPKRKEKYRYNRTIKAESFSANTNLQPKKLKANSFNIDNRQSTSKKRKKDTVLNMFKEQLKMDVKSFDEPQNLYEALKIIAETKRKCQRTIHFEEEMRRKRRDSGFPECTFKSPKVIKNCRKKKTKNNVLEPVQKPLVNKEHGKKMRRKETITASSAESQYSLQVLGYDYKTPVKQTSQRPKEVVFTYHSTPSSSDVGDSIEDPEYTDGFFNTFKRAPSISSHEF
ncbi:unnamed protein product [Chilo suppressalis]|uniref:Uncharacterized protein n=1 Tax=Chilo suppressalis TaxID=168631 RepID=A0ABN8B6Z1_CHISP|nr:unnamed protein product [Chilo suppressalis]